MPNLPYRHLARTATRIETDAPDPEVRRSATDKLPDAEALVSRSHSEQLTGAELARLYETSARTVYAVLEAAGHSREELWTPPKAKRAPKRDTSAHWTLLQRDYVAGDPPLVLAERYGIAQQVIDRNLKAIEGLPVRNKQEAGELRARQRAEADLVRYRLRTGALEDTALDLGVDAGHLRAVLEAQGLLLHDL